MQADQPQAPGAAAAARVLLPGGVWGGAGTVRWNGGVITAIEPGGAGEGTLTPGLIDLHSNGAFGLDFAAARPEQWPAVLRRLAAHGVTAVQPTAITAPLPELAAMLGRVAAAPAALPGAARILGAHLEGPFLAELRRGAHPAEWLRDPSADGVAALLDNPAASALRTVTLAPERPGALAAIRRLVAAGVVVSVGHSDATAAQVLAAADAGASMVTHVFNAMRPLHHRHPATVGVALTDPRLWCCLIVDGLHVDPLACRMVFAAAGARVVAVSDSILLAGLRPGAQGVFGGAPAVLDAAGLGRRPDGTICGASIVLDEGVRRMVAAGVAPAAILHAATEAPATALRRPELGRIARGAAADLVWWNDDWTPRQVWVGGVAVEG